MWRTINILTKIYAKQISVAFYIFKDLKKELHYIRHEKSQVHRYEPIWKY